MDGQSLEGMFHALSGSTGIRDTLSTDEGTSDERRQNIHPNFQEAQNT